MPSSMRVLRSRRQAISALLGVLSLSACHSWQVGTPTPAQFVEREHPERVRVTRTDSSTVTLDSPAVRGDSLVGLLAGAPAGGDSARTTGLPLSNVESVAVKKASAGKTALLVTGIVILVGVALLGTAAIYCESEGCY